MSRKNALTKKKLKRSVFTLIAIFIFIFSIIIINMIVQDTKSNVATSEEMKTCSSTLESIYKKLDSEEIKLLSDDGSETLTCSVPNKKFGKVIVSRDSDGNLMFNYDYQNSEMNVKLFTSICGFLVMSLFSIVCIFGLLFVIKKSFDWYRKEKTSQKETQTKTQVESQ